MSSSIFENDYDLPGVYMDILPDYSYGYDVSLFGTTDPVLIIGTAFNGPNNGTPVPIYSKEHASYIFGKVYDSEKQQESNLVAGIHDAWDRGCRTIYAVRVGGIDMYKDFNFRVDSKYRFRVMSMFSSNLGKECYIRYFDDPDYGLSITLYKPGERATISQRRQGLVEGDDTVLSTTLRLAYDYGFTNDTPLVDFINLFNGHVDNNVIKLGIINSEGQDITHNLEVRDICLGALFEGIYFIGRSGSACVEETELTFNLVNTINVYGIEQSNRPYKRFKGKYFRTLVENTDITQPYPIYADKDTLANVLREVSIIVNTKTGKEYDWLNEYKLSDRAFVPDTVDYEEVDISGFDLYQRLGMGYAITAVAERRTDSQGNILLPRIRETPADNPNHTVPLVEGYYSMLQDATMKYRVLVCTTADAPIKGKLPKSKEFLQTTPVSLSVLQDHILLTPIMKEDDLTEARSYQVAFRSVPETSSAKLTDVYSSQVFPVISILPTNDENEDNGMFQLKNHTVPQGTMFFEHNGDGTFTLVRYTSQIDRLVTGTSLIDKYIIAVDGRGEVNDANSYFVYKGEYSTDETSNIVFKKVTDLSIFKKGDGSGENAIYLLGDQVDNVFVFEIKGSELDLIGDLNGLLTKDQSIPVIFAEDMLFQPNDVIINSSAFVDITFEELVDELNDNEVFNKIFTASLTDTGKEHKDERILEIIPPPEDVDIATGEFTVDQVVYSLDYDRVIDYNYNLYIPYRTTDNFARQFAQHCTYTELRTAPTWGFIGNKRLNATDIISVAKAVNRIANTDFQLYAKNAKGKNMMDRNSMPYPIGRNLSIVFTQYPTYIENEDYTYYSNGAAGYAAMVSYLPLDQSSTNQPFNVDHLSYYLTRNQHVLLNNKGIVTLKMSYTRGIVITDGTTMAPSDSVFRRLSASRIVGAVEELIRAVAEPYIGKQNHQANRNSLHTDIKSQLDKLVGVLIEQYQFVILSDTTSERYNYIDIDYELVPIYEIRQIRNRIQVKERLTATAI